MPQQRARSSAGCDNCKLRKIKCDETRPSCTRCVGRRLKCSGFPTNKTFRWSSKHEVPRRSIGQESVQARSRVTQHPPLTRPAVFDGDEHCDLAVNWASGSAEPANPCSELTVELVAIPSSIDTIHSHIPDPDVWIWEQRFEGQMYPCPEVDLDYEAYASPPWALALPNSVDVGFEDSPQQPGDQDVNVCFTTAGSLNQTLRGIDQQISTPETSKPTSLSSISTPRPSLPPLSGSLLHVPTMLVDYYFQAVCRECSTFDSTYNPFRTMVSRMRDESAAMNYTIQSLAASKLADDIPRLRLAGIEAQGQAVKSLRDDGLVVDALHNVTDTALCTILLLGMTTSWHIPGDIGLGYNTLAQSIITAKAKTPNPTSPADLDFYQNAVNYWSMILSIVSARHHRPDALILNHTSIAPFPKAKIMPHPWTGASPISQQLFGSVLRLIRQTRFKSTVTPSTFSRAAIKDLSNAIATAERLEEECWSTPIPSVDDLEDTGDANTPPLHHVLTAKAYLLSALLHIYMIFPDVLTSRIQSFATSGMPQPVSNEKLCATENSHIISPSHVWPQRLATDSHMMWTTDLGLYIVNCISDISVRSGTRVVHVPLLLSVASALVLSRGGNQAMEDVPDIYPACTPHPTESRKVRTRSGESNHSLSEVDQQVRHCRNFITDRLETMHALMRFHAIDNVHTIIKEVWKRADAGSCNTFWMDIMHELHCETLFG